MALGLGSGMVFSSSTDTLIHSYSASFGAGDVDGWVKWNVDSGSLVGEAADSGRLKLTYTANESGSSGVKKEIGSPSIGKKSGDYYKINFSIKPVGTFDGADPVQVRASSLGAASTTQPDLTIGEWNNLSLTGTSTSDAYTTVTFIYIADSGDYPDNGDIIYIKDVNIQIYRPFGN